MKLEVNFFSLENLKRDLFKKTRHIDNKPFTKEDLQQYDYETLFYNIFFDRNNKNLIIVGPRLGNFKELLFPFEINFNKKLLKKYILIGINPMIFILKFELNSPVLEENHVQVILKNKLSKNFLIKKNNLKVGKNVLVTKQKNNKLIWIEDWIKHYQKIGVNTIVIYDNNSDYQDELIKKYKDDENIYIIPYNFKFGMINCHYHKYMQEALLNDFLYQFCDNNYILNFDIDELLQINLLSEILKPKINMYFYQKQVPVIEDLPQEFSFNNFKFVNKNITLGGFKYIIDSKNTIILSTHKNFSSNKAKFNKNIFFYHYKGITTNWKPYSNRFNIIKVNIKELDEIIK